MAISAGQVLVFLSMSTFRENPLMLSEFVPHDHQRPKIQRKCGTVTGEKSRKRLQRSKVTNFSMNTPVDVERNINSSAVVEKTKSRTTLNLTAIVTVKKEKRKDNNIMDVLQPFMNPSGSQPLQATTTTKGSGVVLQLVGTELDPETKEPRLSDKFVLHWTRSPKVVGVVGLNEHIESYRVEFTVDSNFGMPGAITISNKYDKEFFLKNISIEEFVHLDCNSWVQPTSMFNSNPRVFFSNKALLPSQTPTGLKLPREKELKELRGDGNGIRLPWDRIYDYDMYNDLGDPDKGIQYARPTLGGKQNPHPRRCRTGRPPTNSGMNTETPASAAIPAYVPRDEEFEDSKDTDISRRKLKGIFRYIISYLVKAKTYKAKLDAYNKVPHDNLLTSLLLRGQAVNHLPLLRNLTKIQSFVQEFLIFDPPKNTPNRVWGLRDDEFAQRVLAGINPLNIEKLTIFPPISKLDTSIYGNQESALRGEHILGHLDGMSVQQALEENRLFILDYHDIFLPFLNLINSLDGRKSYATRTLFFLTNVGTLKPVAIELSLPWKDQKASSKQVLTPPVDATSNWLWQLAKAHVCSNDAGVHQLVNHWLRVHACMEPFIIAAHRQLSVMHPIFKLLDPHMRYTLKINTMARESLINAEGTTETFFTPGKYCMQLSCAAYRDQWRFDLEALPDDLIRRGLAVPDPKQEHGLRLVIKDYPYANDGLLYWSAIQKLVNSYVNYYYPNEHSIQTDKELQSWYSESIDKGHADLRFATWWPRLDTPNALVKILATFIWIVSAQHAALNFGQYPYGGHVPARPPLMRRLLPQQDEPAEYETFLADPQGYFLSSLPSTDESVKFVSVLHILSAHSVDEEYIGQRDLSCWSGDQEILEAFYRFSVEIKMIEQEIERRNSDHRLRNRCGAGIPPYELLLPNSMPGVTSRGVPNSVTL